MEFNKDKVQIKHILELERDLQDWPSADDILYFVCCRADAKDRNEDFTFSDYIIQKKLEVESDKIQNMNNSLLKLENIGFIEKIRENDSKVTYKLLKNPYIE